MIRAGEAALLPAKGRPASPIPPLLSASPDPGTAFLPNRPGFELELREGRNARSGA